MALEDNKPLTHGESITLKEYFEVRLNYMERAVKLASKLILQVHDELILEVPDAELMQVRLELPRLMTQVAKLSVPLVAEVGIGPNWEAAH